MVCYLFCWLLFLAYTPVRQAEAEVKPRNIILVIGDGMGLAHIALAEYLHRPPSALQQMEIVGLQKTHSSSHLITDSGAAATAMSCGVKTFNSAIGVDADSMPVVTIMELARDAGYKTGFVVTSSVVHATPAAFYAHVDSRGSYEEIAHQLSAAEIDVFVGGGERYFYNRYADDDDLIDEMKQKDYEVIHHYDMNGMRRMESIARDKKIACFTAFEDPVRAYSGRSYLPWMVSKTMDALEKRSAKGYFMMVEASQIDWAAHANDPDWLTYEMQDAYDMLEILLDKVRKDQETLLIVTSDHECGYMSLKGKRSPRVEFNSKSHTPQMVPVFASGPGAVEFQGIYDNTEIFEKMKRLMGL